jgi:hypothetical protein
VVGLDYSARLAAAGFVIYEHDLAAFFQTRNCFALALGKAKSFLTAKRSEWHHRDPMVAYGNKTKPLRSR